MNILVPVCLGEETPGNVLCEQEDLRNSCAPNFRSGGDASENVIENPCTFSAGKENVDDTARNVDLYPKKFMWLVNGKLDTESSCNMHVEMSFNNELVFKMQHEPGNV